MSADMDELRPYNPTASEKRKLHRSVGSFTLGEFIAAPTPLKINSVQASPPTSRREKRKSTDDKLFGEAGQEIQTILCEATSKRVYNVNISEYRVNESYGSPPTRAANPIALNSAFKQAETSSKPHFIGIRGFLFGKPKQKRLSRTSLALSRSASWPGNGKAKPTVENPRSVLL